MNSIYQLVVGSEVFVEAETKTELIHLIPILEDVTNEPIRIIET
jgi:hypothetical protein